MLSEAVEPLLDRDCPTSESTADGVDDPRPRFPLKYELAVVLAIKFPTVSCVPVAVSAVPAELETMMEFGENDPERFETEIQVLEIA